ncbi:hypothetical protein [Oceanobacillus alkalisoli]|uniref:hypothetical protein n=1 Tax=Oceanobacillus alkalisoli TaxID=2925113 RepID=UPI001EE4C9F4|nr:hypothetical protein [Oceanobacillus alkalisoli]MCG5104460.1 hypothetical protein [Oceanobacillus alkalisoli]
MITIKKLIIFISVIALLSACSGEDSEEQVIVDEEQLKEELREEVEEEVLQEIEDKETEEEQVEAMSTKEELNGMDPWDYYDDVNDFRAEIDNKVFFDMSDAENIENRTIEEVTTGDQDTLFSAYLITFIQQTEPDGGSEYHDVMNEANSKLIDGEFDEVVELVEKAKEIRESEE